MTDHRYKSEGQRKMPRKAKCSIPMTNGKMLSNVDQSDNKFVQSNNLGFVWISLPLSLYLSSSVCFCYLFDPQSEFIVTAAFNWTWFNFEETLSDQNRSILNTIEKLFIIFYSSCILILNLLDFTLNTLNNLVQYKQHLMGFLTTHYSQCEIRMHIADRNNVYYCQ